MLPGEAQIGKRVRVGERHRIAERRNLVGRFGGEEYVAIDVRFAGGECRLFWPADLYEISTSQPSSCWRSVFGRGSYGE